MTPAAVPSPPRGRRTAGSGSGGRGPHSYKISYSKYKIGTAEKPGMGHPKGTAEDAPEFGADRDPRNPDMSIRDVYAEDGEV